jgi:hypothetical protein
MALLDATARIYDARLRVETGVVKAVAAVTRCNASIGRR